MESVSQFFHILGGSRPAKEVVVKWQKVNMKLHFTLSCCNASKEFTIILLMKIIKLMLQIMNKVDLESNKLVRYTPITNQQINFQN